jgi:cell division protein FtsA
MASALATLSEDEKKLGAAVADIGSGTTDLVVYKGGSLCYTASLPVGGSHITNDVAVGMRTPQGAAEEIKKKYGTALSDLVDAEEAVDIEGVGGRNSRSVRRKDLCDVIEPRVEEILNMIGNSIFESGMSQLLGSGVILTGGTSLLDGITDLGEYILDMPVRLGTACRVGGLSETVKSPAFATAVGLLFYAQTQQDAEAIKEVQEESFFGGIRNSIRRIFKEPTQAK